MSDGYADAVEHFRTLMENYLKAAAVFLEERSLANWQSFIDLSQKVKAIPLPYWRSEFNIEEAIRLTEVLPANAEKIASEDEYLFELLLMAINTRRLTLLMRLKSASSYRDDLLIFTDKDWRTIPNGIHYPTGLPFEDGDQDILIGFAKKLFGQGLAPEKPRVIIARYFAKPSRVLPEVNIYSGWQVVGVKTLR